jgi:hypothetical protein
MIKNKIKLFKCWNNNIGICNAGGYPLTFITNSYDGNQVLKIELFPSIKPLEDYEILQRDNCYIDPNSQRMHWCR